MTIAAGIAPGVEIPALVKHPGLDSHGTYATEPPRRRQARKRRFD